MLLSDSRMVELGNTSRCSLQGFDFYLENILKASQPIKTLKELLIYQEANLVLYHEKIQGKVDKLIETVFDQTSLVHFPCEENDS